MVSSLERSTNDMDVVPEPSNGLAGAGGIGFRTRSNLSLDWERGNFGINWGLRYYSAVKEQCFSPRLHSDECSHPGQQAPWYSGVRNYNRRGSTTFHDVQVRYSLPWDATVSVGANNVFEKYGPIMYSKPNSAFSYYGGYDIGRFVYMKYQQRF